MTPEDAVEHAAAGLDEATVQARPMAALPFGRPITLAEAYAVQRRLIARRVARGDGVIGVKIGLTREEKWAACGAGDVILGVLTQSMLLPDGTIPLDRFIAAGVEPELAFRLGAPLSGTVTFEAALAAVDGVAPALEIADSRLANRDFVLHDIVADNSSAAGLVVGGWQAPRDISALDAGLLVDGMPVAAGNTRTVSGHPLRSVVAAARLLASMGLRVGAGGIILSGGLAPARPLRRGEQVACRIEGLGEVSARAA